MSLLDGILQQVTSSVDGPSGQQTGLVNSVLTMLMSNPGALQALIQKMEQNGLGAAAQSWVGTGSNHAITAEQVKQVLGNQQLQELAAQHGIDVNQIASHLAQILPVAVDKLTPSGQLPQPAAIGAGPGGLGDLLKGFMNGGDS